jgi:hypothetical protein
LLQGLVDLWSLTSDSGGEDKDRGDQCDHHGNDHYGDRETQVPAKQMRLTGPGRLFRKQHHPAALLSVAVALTTALQRISQPRDLAVRRRRHTSRLEVTQQRLGRRLNVVGILEVISNLSHQNVLVGRGELRAAFLMTARKLVHLHSYPIPTPTSVVAADR